MNKNPGFIDVSLGGTLGTFSLEARFRVPASGITGLYGPSGTGKTTVLRSIAGLAHLSGHVKIGEDIWQDDSEGIFLRPHQRPLGYVFQEASLFRHLSVKDNLLYGQKRQKTPAGEQVISEQDVIELLGIRHLLNRSPVALSGGERQRVAIGRALMSQPGLLLLDEPLSALDRQARDEILPYLESLHETLSIPSLYVSHDMSELERLADTLVLFERGRILASGPLQDLQADSSLPLMQAPEAAVTLTGKVVSTDQEYGLAAFMVGGGTLTASGAKLVVGEQRRLQIKASDVSFSLTEPEQSSILNCLPATITGVHPSPRDQNHVNILAVLGTETSGDRIVGRVTRKSLDTLNLVPGMCVYAQIKSVALKPGR